MTTSEADNPPGGGTSPAPPRDENDEGQNWQELLDDALADSFPASDPPSIARPPAKGMSVRSRRSS